MTVELSLNDTAHRGWRLRRESEGSRAVGCGYTDGPSCTLACIYTTQPASGSHLIAALSSCCSPRQLSGQSTNSSRFTSTAALKEQFSPKNSVIVYSHADGKTGEVSSSTKHSRLAARQGLRHSPKQLWKMGTCFRTENKNLKRLHTAHLVQSKSAEAQRSSQVMNACTHFKQGAC